MQQNSMCPSDNLRSRLGRQSRVSMCAHSFYAYPAFVCEWQKSIHMLWLFRIRFNIELPAFLIPGSSPWQPFIWISVHVPRKGISPCRIQHFLQSQKVQWLFGDRGWGHGAQIRSDLAWHLARLSGTVCTGPSGTMVVSRHHGPSPIFHEGRIQPKSKQEKCDISHLITI